MNLLDSLQDFFETRFGQQVKVLFRSRLSAFQAFCPHLDLLNGFLTRDVKNPAACPLEALRHLKQQCGLSYTRLSSQQHQGARHNAAAQDAIQLGIRRENPR